MAKPVILITIGKQGLPAARAEIQAVSACCNMQYVHSVVRAGGAPVLLPALTDEGALRAALQTAHGLLLTGGGDVLSLAYGEEPHPASKYQDPARDEMELQLVQLALEQGLPILGICRGVQLLNVALGGSLVQDVPSQVPGAVQHYSKGLDAVLVHTVEIEEGTLLGRLFGARSTAVNSYHHQAVKDLGKGLCINCRAKDGVIEGVESTDGRPILGVQFHPEELAERHPVFRSLFNWLVEQASSRIPRQPLLA